MAISKYVYAENDADWIDTAAARIEKMDKGKNQISYTDFADSSANVSIAALSYFEVAGSGYLSDTDTAVGGTAATGLCYILATGATTTASIAWTTTAPAWRDDFQGYYATVASNVRALGGCTFDGNSYDERFIYAEQGYKYYGARTVDRVYEQSGDNLKTKVLEIGDWDMDTYATKSVNHGLSDHTKIRMITVIIRNDDDSYNYLGEVPYGAAMSTVASLNVGWTSTEIRLRRGIIYDTAAYDSTSYNRGWVTVWYEGVNHE